MTYFFLCWINSCFATIKHQTLKNITGFIKGKAVVDQKFELAGFRQAVFFSACIIHHRGSYMHLAQFNIAKTKHL